MGQRRVGGEDAEGQEGCGGVAVELMDRVTLGPEGG